MSDHTNFSPETVEDDVQQVDGDSEASGTPDVQEPHPQMGPAYGNQPPENALDENDEGPAKIQIGYDQSRKLVLTNFGPHGIRTLGQTPEQARHMAACLTANADAIEPRDATDGSD